MESSWDFISMCDQDPFLLENIAMGGKTWCYQFDPKSKRQSMVWCSPTSPRPKKSRLQNSKVKTLLSALYDSKTSSIGNLFLQVKPLMHHFTRQFWTNCFSVSGGFGQSCTGLENGCCSTIMPHAYSAIRVRQFLAQKMVAMLDHPPYFRDLVPVDFFLIPRLKAAV